MSMPSDVELPPPCAVGLHKACIVHRCGGRDANFYNRCGLCGREIERADGEPWATAEQVEEYTAEMRREADLEWSETHNPREGEERCPPRE